MRAACVYIVFDRLDAKLLPKRSTGVSMQDEPIIRPTQTDGIAMGALTFLTNMGLFIGQSPAFFAYMTGLAQAADHARHGRG